MKGLLIGSVVIAGAIAVYNPAFAQDAIGQMEATPLPEMANQSQLLDTQPLSVRRPGDAVQSSLSPLNANQLSQVASSIQAKPGQASGDGIGIPANLIPRDLIHTPAASSSDTDPIGFFKAPGPNPSYGINLNAIQ